MPVPTQGAVHVDRLLTNMLVGYRNPAYIADDSAPIVPVDRQTNIIPRLNQSYFFRNDAKLRAPGTASVGGGFTVDNTLTYFCPRYSYRHEIPDEVRDNTDLPYDQDRESAFLCADKTQMARELAFASILFTTGIWGSDMQPNTNFNQWSNYAGSLPLEDLTQWMDQIEGKIGREANNLIIGKQVWVGSGGLSNGGGLRFHPEVIDLIKYTQKGVVSPDLFAGIVGAEQPISFRIGRAIYTTTQELQPPSETGVTYTRIWGKSALLYYNEPGPSIWKPTALQTFVWNRVANAIQYVKRMRDEQKEVDIIEANSYFTQKLIVANAGIFANSVVN